MSSPKTKRRRRVEYCIGQQSGNLILTPDAPFATYRAMKSHILKHYEVRVKRTTTITEEIVK
jgi:hypothetical protein